MTHGGRKGYSHSYDVLQNEGAFRSDLHFLEGLANVMPFGDRVGPP